MTCLDLLIRIAVKAVKRRLKMDDYSTYQGALEIFKKAGCTGTVENCILGAAVDKTQSAAFKGAMAGRLALGSAGFLVGNAIGRKMDSKTNKTYDYNHVLINITENGVGIMPLQGHAVAIYPRKSQPDYSGFVFIPNQEISNVKINNFAGIREQIKKVVISLADNHSLHFYIRMTLKALPYQEENMKKFLQKY